MIRVPSHWRCSSFRAAFVECEGGRAYLCRVVPSYAPTTTVAVEPTVEVEPGIERHCADQSVLQTEVVHVEPLRTGGCASEESQPLVFRLCSDAPVEADQSLPAAPQAVELPRTAHTLRIACATETRTAVSVTLSGPRFDARATLSELSAVLSGCFVTVGARVRASAAEVYTVLAVETRHGHGGIALVEGGCRVRLNDTLSQRRDTAPPTALVGLREELSQLQLIFSVARTSPGKQFGVLVHGPRGCGVRTVVETALQSAVCREGGCDIVPWSPALDAVVVRHRSRSAVIALVIPCCERYFSVDGEEGDACAAALAARKLRRDALVLTSHDLEGEAGSAQGRSGHCPAVVIVALTHEYGAVCGGKLMGGPVDGVFATSVSLGLPDAADRAALLASVRGGVPPSACMDEAHSLVGRSRAEVLEAGRDAPAGYRPPFKPVRWDDIGGLAEVKARLHKALVWPQQHPEAFERFGLTPPNGILLYGPPGCAKTTLVKALCSEGFFSLIYLDSANVISAYVGESERRLRDVFRRAAQQAPCIVFFDEVEVIGARRGSGESGKDTENVRLLSTLLTEIDGFAATRGVCFVGATNVPHLLDDALLRPGRFDYLVHVPLPSHEDRERILHLFLEKTAVDVARIAAATEGFSGADISALCTAALLSVEGSDALQMPCCLQDPAWTTSYFLEQASYFRRTHYDAKSLEEFQRKVQPSG